MKPRVLVTGGFGNLGCWITKEFLEDGYDVTVATSSGRVPEIFKSVTVLPLDLGDAASVGRALEGRNFEAVVHAGSINDGFIEGYYWRAYRVNVEGTSSLLHHLRRNQLRRFVYLSTFHVYGVDRGAVSEATTPDPKNDYATSHLAAESVVKQHAANGLPATILRLTNGYGRPLVPESAKWHLIFNDLVRMASTEGRLVLRSDPSKRRDFLWMGDISKAICHLCTRSDVPRGVLNLSFGASVSLGELAEQIRDGFREVAGKDLPIEAPAAGEREDDLRVDSSRLWEYLGWRPSIRIKEEAVESLRGLTSAARSHAAASYPHCQGSAPA